MSRNELDRVIDVLKTEQDNIQKTIVRLEAARMQAKKQRRPRARAHGMADVNAKAQ